VSAITAIVIHQLGNLRNSRKLEAQADTEGLKALARAGIPLDGLPVLFRKLEGEQRPAALASRDRGTHRGSRAPGGHVEM
jgi:predicted Zn-dependent protease